MLTGYPRPQLVRENWLNLNGEWDFCFDDQSVGEIKKWYLGFQPETKIVVPYTYETELSTVHDERQHSVIWYQKEVPLSLSDKRILLHFEGSDYRTKVWVNGACAGEHTGGYAAFGFDITGYSKDGANLISVQVEDSKSCIQPRGKQRWTDENFGCWYVQTTGIWKSVWIEEVSAVYLQKVKITPDIDSHKVTFYTTLQCAAGEKVSLQCKVSLEGEEVSTVTLEHVSQYCQFSIELADETKPWKVALWYPHSPKLYDVTFTLLKDGQRIDEVTSYFGMRKLSMEHGKILLNNRLIYQRLILDQGYWKESHLTPPSEEAMIRDIDLVLEAGYNGVRKHQKTEDSRFLYWCDKKGVLVWSEMAAQYTFNDTGIAAFTKEWMEIVEQNYNHPCIVTWVPFNESWGIEHVYTNLYQQKFTEGIYYLTKSFDPMRPVVVNDGWEHTVSDIITLHDYDENTMRFAERYADKQEILENRTLFNMDRCAFAKGYEYKGQPVMISEFGGIAFSSDRGWGYGKQVNSEEDFILRFDRITSAIKDLPYACGYCYTQITDVQQEINGLYTEDREAKIDIEKIREINLK